MAHRIFAALVPPADVVEHLDAFLEPRREHTRARQRDRTAVAQERLRWTPAEQFHVTLAFAPAVPDRALDDLLDAVRGAVERRAPLTARLRGGGAFPDPFAARVLYAGLDLDEPGQAGLEALVVATRSAFARSGAEVDGGRFSAHLTVARANRGLEATRWLRILDTYEGPAWTADAVSLVASHLGEGPRKGPRHEVLDLVALGG